MRGEIVYTLKGHDEPTHYAITWTEWSKDMKTYDVGNADPDVPIRYLKAALEWVLSGGGDKVYMPGDLRAAREVVNRFNDVADLLEKERIRLADDMDAAGCNDHEELF